MHFIIKDLSGEKTDYLALFLRGLFIGAKVNNLQAGDWDYSLLVDYKWDGNQLNIRAKGITAAKTVEAKSSFLRQELALYASSTEDGNLAKALRLAIVQCLRELMQREFPWGILTGVRPTKTVGFIQSAGIAKAARSNVLEKMFGLLPKKSEYLIEIADRGQSLLPADARKGYLLYISIPFCPSRCNYCSFFTGIADSRLIETYLHALFIELQEMAAIMDRFFDRVDAVYIGGGTPSMLNCQQIRELLRCVHSLYPLAKNCEITFEAGRPETITPEMVRACAESGVNRMCVNPQTMHDATAFRMGRNCNSTKVIGAVDCVRSNSNLKLNMDLIIGLPSEDSRQMLDSLQQVIAMRPDNITLHALALKRATILRENNTEHAHDEACLAFSQANDLLPDSGYRPYYLYRQKFTAGDLENVGYATPGKECYYNVSMIEDWQTVLAVGAGANSKFVGKSNKFPRDENPKDPGQYQQRLVELLARKEALLDKSFSC
jgi:oxygen-independent coproporphyrinogen-3 oxidase